MSTVTAEKRDWVRQMLGVALDGAPAAPGRAPGDGHTTQTHAATHGTIELGDIEIEPAGDDAADMASLIDAAEDASDWAQMAQLMNALPSPDLIARVARMNGEVYEAVHDAAVKPGGPGKDSAVAMATTPINHPVLGSRQAERAAALEKQLAPEDQKKYKALLDGAKTPKEKQYLTKGLAAGHTVAELEAFAAKIAGKDEEWMRNNLSLTGQSNGRGVQQQWHDSCGPTTFEAVQGELDPLYALKKHEDNPNLDDVDVHDGTKKNADLAADQKAVLTGGGGIAVNRDQTGGRGMWIAGALNNISASTGVTYDLKKIGEGATLDEGVTALNDATAAGTPVPIAIGNGPKNYQHYVLVVASDPGPPRTYTIHDPWDGVTVTRSEDQMRTGKIDIAGCNDFESFDKPTPVPVSP